MENITCEYILYRYPRGVIGAMPPPIITSYKTTEEAKAVGDIYDGQFYEIQCVITTTKTKKDGKSETSITKIIVERKSLV